MLPGPAPPSLQWCFVKTTGEVFEMRLSFQTVNSFASVIGDGLPCLPLSLPLPLPLPLPLHPAFLASPHLFPSGPQGYGTSKRLRFHF